MKTSATAALAVLVLMVPQAAAACVNFQVTGSDLSVRYDPFSPSPVERIFTLRAQRIDPLTTAVRFILVDGDSPGGETRIGSGPRGYGIRSVSNSSRAMFFNGAEQPNATNGLLINFGSGQGGDIATETLRLSIPAGQDTAAGDFFEPLEIRYICETADGPGTPDFQRGARVAIDLHVPEMISTYIGAPGVRRGQIAFGSLIGVEGLVSRDLVVTAQSTIPYNLEYDSTRGRLKRRDDDDYGLDYDVRLSGYPVGREAVLSCARTIAPLGRTHALQVTLGAGQAAMAPAGTYSDTITLSFTPRLGLSGAEGCTAGL